MTNSEAIEVLKANYPDPCFELLREAVDTAIYTLSAQPTQTNTSNALKSLDCIYRQDAINALGDEPEVWTDKDKYAQGLYNQWHYDRNAILTCPSAQPRSGKWIKRKGGALGYNCSCCGKSDISNHFDYCPNCGADMKGDRDEQE